MQSVLHCVSHLIDIRDPQPAWHGPLDTGLLTASTLVLAWMWGTARRREAS